MFKSKPHPTIQKIMDHGKEVRAAKTEAAPVEAPKVEQETVYPIETVGLSEKIANALIEANVTNVEQLIEVVNSEEGVTSIKGIGKKTAEEIDAFLNQPEEGEIEPEETGGKVEEGEDSEEK
jgi:DNA polymerase/3'-5' exonuclease PolX